MPDLDYKEILERYAKNLDCEISNQHNERALAFFAVHYSKGNMTDEDCIEMRGYFKGLKVAREMLERVIEYEKYEKGVNEECQ